MLFIRQHYFTRPFKYLIFPQIKWIDPMKMHIRQWIFSHSAKESRWSDIFIHFHAQFFFQEYYKFCSVSIFWRFFRFLAKISFNLHKISPRYPSIWRKLDCDIWNIWGGADYDLKSISKYPSIQIFCSKRNFTDFSLRRLVENSLIQPQFEYACNAWFPVINKTLSKKSIQIKINVSGSV